MIKSAKWIWTSDKERENEYSEFTEKFCVSNSEKVILNLSCDGVYSVYINGELAAFSACADYPWYKFYDEIDISKFCKEENEIKIVVWHLGKDSQTYINDKAYVVFEITANGKTVAKSDENTLSRVMNEYKNGYDKMITPQLGQSFLYDNTVVKIGYSESEVVDKTYDLHKRNIKGLKLCDRLPIKTVLKDNSIAIRGNQKPLKKDAPCSGITVSDCILSSAACGVRVGVGNGVISNCRLTGLKMVDTNIGIGICPSYGQGKYTAISDITFENCRIDAVQTILMLPNWHSDIDDPEAKKVKNLRFRNIDAVSSRASLLVESPKGNMFENITFEDSTFTLLPGSEPPRRKHWRNADYGIINLLGMRENIFSNCRGISAEGKTFILRCDR